MPTSVAFLLAFELGMLTAPASLPPMQLKPCPSTPNCVSTQSTNPAKRMDPVAYSGPVDDARARLLRILDRPRVEILESTDLYVHAVFTTRIMRFKDDVEFLFDPDAGVIHFRSASRVGRSDFGTNRSRMESLTRDLESAWHE